MLGAGTDANVFIILYGERDTSSQFKLDNPGKNDFEQSSTSVFSILKLHVLVLYCTQLHVNYLFVLTSKDINIEKELGKLKKIRIGTFLFLFFQYSSPFYSLFTHF